MNKEKVRLALGIISNRIEIEHLSNSDFANLGYEPSSFCYFGSIDIRELKLQAESIIIEAIFKDES